MKYLIVGLGNPGREYEKTRHNVGYMVADEIEKNLLYSNGVLKTKMIIVKPDKYMNLSGEFVKKKADYFNISQENIIVIHDDLDLEFGTIRIRYGDSSAGHNGIQSIIDSFGTKDFWRIRIGIGRPLEFIDPADFVLQRFGLQQEIKLPQVIDTVQNIVLEFVFNNKFQEKTIKLD